MAAEAKLKHFVWAFVCLSLGALSLSVSAVASSDVQNKEAPTDSSAAIYTIDIHVTSLGQALKTLAAQTGAQILYSPSFILGIRSPALQGDYSLAQALTQLLAGTELDYVIGANQAVAIRKKDLADESAEHYRQSSAGLEEIVITGRKLNGLLHRIPVSISSLSGIDMAVGNIQTTEQLSAYVPNFQLRANAPSSGHNASSVVFIRGIGQSEFSPSSDPGVGVYVDGVHHARSLGVTMDMLDLESVEVLRGLQGTLFGRNTIGGAVLINSRKPQQEFSLQIKNTLESDNGYALNGILNLPLTDTLATRIAVRRHLRDGYATRVNDGLDLGNDDSLYGRWSWRWRPKQNLMFDLVADYLQEDENGPAQTFEVINTQAVFPILASIAAGCPGASLAAGVAEIADARCANNQYRALSDYEVDSNAELLSTIESGGAALIVDWVLDQWQWQSISSYREMSWYSSRDADATPLTILHTINDEYQSQFSQEFNWRGRNDTATIDWLVGLYYFDESAFEDNPAIFPSAVGSTNTAVHVENKSYALFGQLSLDLSESMTLTLGLRETKEKKSALPRNEAYLLSTGLNVVASVSDLASCLPGTASATCIALLPGELLYDEVLNTKRYAKTTSDVSLSYQFTPQTMGYLRFASGFKSGGFNSRINQPVVTSVSPTGREFLPAYGPETADTFEVGVKSMALTDNLSFSSSAFWTNYRDMQVQTRRGSAPVLANAGSSEIRGLELDWHYTLMKNTMLSGGFGWLDGRYTSLEPELLALDSESGGVGTLGLDNRLVHTPETSAHIGVLHRHPGVSGLFTSHFNYTYQSKVYFDSYNTEAIAQPAYGLVNASFGWRTHSQRWAVNLALKNILDKRYRLTGNSSFYNLTGYTETTWAREREWALSVEVKL